MKKKVLIPLLALVVLAALFCLRPGGDKGTDVVVYYTNDVHGYIDNRLDEEPGLSYSLVAALKNGTENALLVDVGDHLQGTAFGSMDEGVSIVQIMNAAGYDAAAPGNHEFDYGMEPFQTAVAAAGYPYVSCNFHHEENGVRGERILEPYVMLESGGTDIAFVGILTPETLISSNPANFQDENRNYIYGVDGGSDGSALYASVQLAIDEARAEGADYVIALSHLSAEAVYKPWSSRALIANTTGLDAVLDGHTHAVLESETVTDKAGEPVVLTQTGSNLNAVGKLTITADGEITSELLTAADLADLAPDSEVLALEEAWIGAVNGLLGQVIGHTENTFDNYDSQGKRLVRRQSTNTADFATDALYYLFDEMDVDVAVVNGGGIRNGAITGELTYLRCKEIHTFGNVACLVRVTGQQILDALEWGSKGIPADGTGENGSLLHVSGLKYTLDLTIDSTVQTDEKGIWTGPPTDGYRVQNVQILNRETGAYEPLDPAAEYRLAGYNYILRDLGDGFVMFRDAVNVLDYVAEDYMVLANYIRSFPVDETTGLPVVTGYGDVNGSGRITILTGEE